jgi:hypothetical protein
MLATALFRFRVATADKRLNGLRLPRPEDIRLQSLREEYVTENVTTQAEDPDRTIGVDQTARPFYHWTTKLLVICHGILNLG